MRASVLLLLCWPLWCQAQTSGLLCKNIKAVRTTERITVDGVLDELIWSTAPVGDEFVQNEPQPNEPATMNSSVRVVYDDVAIHVGAQLLDPRPDSIMQRLGARDDLGITDWFGITIDPYRSGRNGFAFTVSAANVQSDAIVANEEEDGNWNAVWESATRVNNEGWIVEMTIPYSAFRFPKGEEQTWSVQFVRTVGRTREKTFWNPIDPLQEGWLRQCGTISGIKDVQAPLRLMLYPYVSAYAQHFPQNDPTVKDWSSTFNGGMDVKVGLNDAYTLDMTLIPDFGQVVSDNVVLNLSPFEVQYNENRQFFTEGTELFQRGGIFYSRRIGGEPLLRGALYEAAGAGETVTEDPGVSKLINATKVSGRGAKGFGLGVLNAITRATYGTLTDSAGTTRAVLTDPLTNYSVIVADQQVKNNGYVSLINTNVMRDGSVYDANSTALDFLLNNKARSIQGGGVVRISQKFGDGVDNTTGYSYTAGLSKTGGSWTYGAEYNEVSPEFDPNDLGFWQFTNNRGVQSELSYTNYRPKVPWQRWGVTLEGEYLRVVRPDHFFNFAIGVNTFRILRGFNAFGGGVRIEPIRTFDPFEPRAPGRLYEFPMNVMYNAWISTNYNKPFAIDLRGNYRRFYERDRKSLSLSAEPRFRPNDRLFFILPIEQEFNGDDIGWVAFDDAAIIFGQRDLRTTSVGLEGSYSFTNRVVLSARIRHYWSRAEYVAYHELLADGSLADTDYTGLYDDGSSRHNVDFDAFTTDILLRWNFAPGSELTLGWKDNIFARDNIVLRSYADDLRSTLQAPGINSFSLKVLYFIDAARYIRTRKV